MSHWASIDGGAIHLNCREPLGAEEMEAITEIVRAVRREKPHPEGERLAKCRREHFDPHFLVPVTIRGGKAAWRK